jgi:hypothetical protein
MSHTGLRTKKDCAGKANNKLPASQPAYEGVERELRTSFETVESQQ